MASLAATGLFSVHKTLGLNVDGWLSVLWRLDYGHGPIKRGLAPTVLHLLAAEEHWDTAIVWAHWVACHGLVGLLLLAAASSIRTSRHPLTLGAAWLVFMSGPFLPTTAHNSGYLDVHGLVLMTGAALLVAQGRISAAALFGVLGVTLHEGFLFLWLPVLIMALWGAWRTHTLAWFHALLLAPLPAVALVLALHSQDAVFAELAAVAVDDRAREAYYAIVYGQTALSAFAANWDPVHLSSERLRNYGLTALYTVLPTALIIIGAALAPPGRQRARADDIAVFTMAALSPALILVMAVDVSRLLGWTSWAAAIALAIRPPPAAAGQRLTP